MMAIEGAMTALVTPFTDNAQVDWQRFASNIEFQIEQGIDGLVPVGTTGESPTLTHDEHRAVIEKTVAIANRRVKVIAGTGSNATAEALQLTAHAKEAGADAALVVNPYYNKPTQEGLYRHFMKVAEVGLPVVLYNIPGRTGVMLTVQTIVRLAEHPNIVAVKEATGLLDMASQIVLETDLDVISGDDSLTLPIIAVGGKGVISVLSNLLPDRVKALVQAALTNQLLQARQIHQTLLPLFKGMFVETNPIPIKTAMALCGRDTGTMRLPLCEPAASSHASIKKMLQTYGLLA